MAEKKARTPKQLANDERLRKAAQERRQKKREQEQREQELVELNKKDEQIAQSPAPEANADLGELLKQIQQIQEDNTLLKAALLNQQQNDAPQNANQQGSMTTSRGIVGTFEKYITDPSRYPDPRERLTEFFETSPKYRRFGFKDNYELRWEVKPMRPYERKDGVIETQPRFVMGLDRIIYDEDTYEPTNGRYVVKEIMLFEDPETALIIADEQGLNLDKSNEKAFLDEMRFIRLRDWLVECFFPSTPTKSVSQRKDMVIDGKQVQYFEVSGQTAQNIPFEQLKNKI